MRTGRCSTPSLPAEVAAVNNIMVGRNYVSTLNDRRVVVHSRWHRMVAAVVYASKIGIYIWAHPANRGKRVCAIGRVLLFFVRAGILDREVTAKIGNQSRIIATPRRFASVKVVCANPPDYLEMRTWHRYLKGRDFFVDVGANIGSYSIWAAELGAEVLALEPAEDTYAALEANVKMNGYPIRTLRAAAGSICGEMRLTDGKDDKNRLVISGGVLVPMVTVDSIVPGRIVNGIKIDVEGYELEVLRGCEKSLSERRIELIQLEWNATSFTAVGTDRGPVARLLRAYGYKLYRPDWSGALRPLDDWGFGADVFARFEI